MGGPLGALLRSGSDLHVPYHACGYLTSSAHQYTIQPPSHGTGTILRPPPRVDVHHYSPRFALLTNIRFLC